MEAVAGSGAGGSAAFAPSQVGAARVCSRDQWHEGAQPHAGCEFALGSAEGRGLSGGEEKILGFFGRY